MEITTFGIDLGKTVFHVVGLNAAGEMVIRKRFSRAQLLRFTANLNSLWFKPRISGTILSMPMAAL